jgi:hypothetical protein
MDQCRVSVNEAKYIFIEILDSQAETVKSCIQQSVGIIKIKISRIAFDGNFRITYNPEF